MMARIAALLLGATALACSQAPAGVGGGGAAGGGTGGGTAGGSGGGTAGGTGGGVAGGAGGGSAGGAVGGGSGFDFGPQDAGLGVICAASRWCWDSPSPQGNSINGVFAFSASDLWTAGDQGTLLHWDGVRWTGSSPFRTPMNAIWGSAPNDVWAVGLGGLTLQWNGTSWTRVQTGTTVELRAITGTSASDIWVAGAQGTIRHWNGTAWSATASGTGMTFNALWASGPADVWAVGNGSTIRRWNGTNWATVTHGISASFYAVWGTGPSDVWVGGNGPLAHWNGSTWTQTSTFVTVQSIHGSSATDIWAGGGAALRAAILHYDGTSWTNVPLPYVDPTIDYPVLAIWGAASGEAFALGGSMHRRAGGAWSRISSPRFDANGLGGSSATDVWAVGNKGGIFHSSGLLWQKMAVDAGTQNLLDVAAAGPNDAWAVGENGTTVHWDGTGWRQVASGLTNVHLLAVWVAPNGEAFTVGSTRALHWKNGAWTPMTPSIAYLNDVWGTSATDVWFAGSTGALIGSPAAIAHWDGSSWATATLPTSTPMLWGISGSGPAEVWAVGDNGTILSFDGGTWARSPSNVAGNLKSVAALSPTDVWATGMYGWMHWDGAAWTRIDGLSGYTTQRVWGANSANVWSLDYDYVYRYRP